MKLSSLLASSSLLALAACAGNGADGRWSDADREHVFRAFEAASSTDYAQAMGDAIGYAAQPSAACPKVVRSGSTTTVTGGCTAGADLQYSGSFTAENLPIEDTGYDPSKPTTVHFDQFTIGLPYPTIFDGDVSATSGGSITTDLDLTFNGILVHSDLALTFSTADSSFTAQPGSSIDVDGFGEADVSGTWAFPEDENQANAGKGAITLDAAQTMVVDFTKPTEPQCWAASIDGKAGSWACLK